MPLSVSGTLITFPTLVAMGYPPVTSTMSNAVGLVAGNASSTWGYRRELRGQGRRLVWQIPASVIGAILGAWLLLHLPEKLFTAVVPVLLIIALFLVVIGPRIQAWAQERAAKAGQSAEDVSRGRMVAVVSSTFAVARFMAAISLPHRGFCWSARWRTAAGIVQRMTREEPADVNCESWLQRCLYDSGFP